MTKFLNVLIAILSAGLIIQYLFGFTAFLVYCACLVSCYLFLKRSGPSPRESLWLSTVVNFCQNFGRNQPEKCGKFARIDHSKDNLYPNLNWSNPNEKLWHNKHSPNTVSSFLAAMFGEGRTSFSLFSLFKRNNNDAGASKTHSSSDGIRNSGRKRNLKKRNVAVDGDLSGSSPMARCTTSYTPMSPRHHVRHRNRITNMNTPSEQLRINSGGKYLSSPLPRFHRTASEMQERPVISPVGFTPHALQRPEVCYPSRNVVGILPYVNLEKIKIPLLETNVNKLRSPVTVRIAPPETGAIHSPKFTSLKHDVPTATTPGDVLTALREGSRKRANNEEESVIMINNMNAKRRRQESNHSTASSSSSIPSLSDFLPDLALCNFSPNYMSPDTSRYMSSPAVSPAMSVDEGGSDGGGGSKRAAPLCFLSPNSEGGSPNLKRSRYRYKNNPILSSLSSSHRYMKRQENNSLCLQTEIRKRKISDSADDGSFQHLRQLKENYENISSELETETPLRIKVMKPSLDVSGNEDNLVETSSEKLPEHTPQLTSNTNSVENKKPAADLPRRKLLSFTTPSVNLEKLSYANVYATKQDYENDRKAEQERVEKMLNSIANDKASSTDKDLMTAKTGIEISKNLISTTKSLETSTSKSSTDVNKTAVTTSGSLSLSSTSSLLSSAAATTTTAAASLSPKSIATTTTLTSSPSSSSEQPTRLTSNTTSVNSMITPLPSLSTSAYPKASDAQFTTSSSSSSSSSPPTSQIQMKSNFQFDLKAASPSTSTAQPSLPVTAPQLSTPCTTVSSSGLVGTTSNSGFQFNTTTSSPNVTATSTGSFLPNISSPFSATSTSLSVPSTSPTATPLSITPPTAVINATQPPSSSTLSAGFSATSKAGFTFPTAVGNPFSTDSSVVSSSVTTLAAAQKLDATNASPASFPSFKADTTTSTSPNVISTSATTTPGFFVFGNTSAKPNQPTSNTPTASTVTFEAPNTTPTKFVFNASSNTTTITSTTTTATTTTAAFGGSSFVFGASTSTPAFGASTSTATPAFGASTSTATPAFGASTSTATPAFGASTSTTTPAFGASTSTTASIFGASTSTAASIFGASTSTAAPVFRASTSTTAPTFGASTSAAPVFGASTSTAAPVFGASTSTAAPIFGASTSTAAPVFGASTSAAAPAFGSSTSTAAPIFGASTSTTAPVFGSSTSSAAPVFGTSTTKSSLVFGASSSAAAPIFGSPSATTSSGLSTSTSSIFGASTSLPAPVFKVPTSSVSSIFGSSSATTAAATITTTSAAAAALSSNSIFNVPQTAATSPIFGSSGVSTATVFAAPATALNIFSTPTATASSAFGAPSMVASSKALSSAAKPATATIFSNPSSTFGGFKDASQTGQAAAAAPSAASNVFGSNASNSSGGFSFTLNNSTNKPTSNMFDSANAKSPAVIFGNSGQQQQQQQQQQQKTDQKFNFTLNSNSGSQVPFGNQPTSFRSFESKPSIFSGQPGAAELTAIKPPTIFGQVPTTTATTGSAASMAKPLFGQLNTSGFAATPNPQSSGNPAIFGVVPPATATATTKPADRANTQNTKIFAFGKTPSTQSGTSQGYDFSASMAGTSQFNFGQGVAMFNVGSGSTAPKMRSNNKARRRGGKK